MRKSLVLLDEATSQTGGNALRYASMRAARTGGTVVVLGLIDPKEIQHGVGVADIMRTEAVEELEHDFSRQTEWVREDLGISPRLLVCEGEPIPEILKVLAADPEIAVIMLDASPDGRAGPLIVPLMAQMGDLPCPVTVVPSALSLARLNQIS